MLRINGISTSIVPISSGIQIAILKQIRELDVRGFWRQI